MNKPTLYLDTNILSALYYTGGSAAALQQQVATRFWWDHERRWFKVFASRFTESELAAGTFGAQRRALAEVRRLPYLRHNAQVNACALKYMEDGLISPSTPADAFQLAFATVHMIDYLMSWNQTHLANPETQRKLEATNMKFGWRAPRLVTPATIPRRVMGQSIQRSDEERRS